MPPIEPHCTITQRLCSSLLLRLIHGAVYEVTLHSVTLIDFAGKEMMLTIALHSIITRTSNYSPDTSHTRCGIWGHSPLCSPDRFRRRMIGDAGWGHNHHSAVWVSLSPGATFRRTATSSIILRSWHHQFLPHRAVEWANNTLIRRLFRWSLRSQTMTSDVTGLCAGDVIDWMSEWFNSRSSW